MRDVVVTCDLCGNDLTFNENENEFEPSILKGWAYINIRGPYKDMEICPRCLKSFLGATKLEEEKEDD